MNEKVIIIAEAGVNHNGSLEVAKKLVDAASKSGADFIKFQTFKTDLIISPDAKKANYQIVNTNNVEETQYEMIKKLELDQQDFIILKNYCEEKKIGFLSTGFDSESIDFLSKLKLPYLKVPSGEITNIFLLRQIAKQNIPVIMSTGMSELKEIIGAIDVLITNGLHKNKITILHCNTEYPTPMQDVNLKAMITLGKELGVRVGYSDHTLGIEVSIAAVALGATIIEKHFTIDKLMSGPDHLASLDPIELKAMVSAIRNVELAISGSGVKEVSKSEAKNILIARKSVYIRKAVFRGEKIKEEDLIMKRPGDGISPMVVDKIIGKTYLKNLPENYKLSDKDFN